MSSHAQPHDEPHIDSIGLYVRVYIGLLILTILTVMVSTTFNLGAVSHTLSLVVAMLIACAKGSLVVLFFMHLLHDDKLIRLVFVVSLFFLGLFFSMTMLDVATRGIGNEIQGSQAFRQIHDLSVIDDVPTHGEHGEHGEEAEGEETHADEQPAAAAGAQDEAAANEAATTGDEPDKSAAGNDAATGDAETADQDDSAGRPAEEPATGSAGDDNAPAE